MLSKLLSRSALQALAGGTAFQRGEEYFSVGAVGRLGVTDDRITARVQGTEAYRVALWGDNGELASACTCPRAADGYFCKHGVAVGLAWMAEQAADEGPEAESGKRGKAERRDPWQDIKDFLRTQPQENLIELLLDVARRDDRLHQSLLLKAERVVAGGDVVQAFQRAITEASSVHGYLDWSEVRSFADNLDELVDSLAELLTPDTAPVLVELAEYAIGRIEGAMEQADDSDGEIGGIVCRLGDLHLAACTMAKPDPAALAERLFHLEMTLPSGLCSFDAATYQVPLGEKGLQRYRDVAEAAWDKVTPQAARTGYDANRAMLTRIMERLAEACGGVDELVAIKSKDLSSSYRYLDIARTLAQADRSDEALAWAERGLEAFAEAPHNDLRNFLAELYLQRGRQDEALQLTWVQFEERPGLEIYKRLHAVAKEFGFWPAQRERALAWLAERTAREAAAPRPWKPEPLLPNHSLRVSIALWEEDLDAAWAAAYQGICDRKLLIALGGKLESARPEDAISLYRRIIPAIVGETNNSAYHEGVQLIRKVGELMTALNRLPQFGDYLAELRVRFKPKRNFIKLLDELARSMAAAK